MNRTLIRNAFILNNSNEVNNANYANSLSMGNVARFVLSANGDSLLILDSYKLSRFRQEC